MYSSIDSSISVTIWVVLNWVVNWNTKRQIYKMKASLYICYNKLYKFYIVDCTQVKIDLNIYVLYYLLIYEIFWYFNSF